MAMKCPNCGAENPEGKKFCGECGRRMDIVATRTCTGCGRSISFEAVVCQYCGHDYRAKLAGMPTSMSATNQTLRSQPWKWSLSVGILVVGIWLIIYGTTYWVNITWETDAALAVIFGVITIAVAVISLILSAAKS